MAEQGGFEAHNVVSGLALLAQAPNFRSVDEFADRLLDWAGVPPGSMVAEPAGFLLELRAVCVARVGGASVGLDRLIKQVILEDLERVIAGVSRVPAAVLQFSFFEEASEHVRARLDHLGFDAGKYSLRVVDKFPPPYEHAAFAAMTYTSEDATSHSIEPGVALLRDRLSPVLSVFYLAHEAVHVALGAVDAGRLACGIEEGLADVLGAELLSELLDANVLADVVTNLRFRGGRPQLSDVYRESLTRVCALVLHHGIDFALDVARAANRRGRHNIRRLDAEVDPFTERSRGHSPTIPPLARRVLAKSMAYDIPIDAFAIITKVESGSRFSEAAPRLGLSIDQVRAAAEETNRRVFLAVSDDEKMIRNETPDLAATGQLRYSC